MKTTKALVGLVWTLAGCLLAACGGDSTSGTVQGGTGAQGGSAGEGCPAGTETCPCYGNDTCNDGLTCASGLCVDLGTGGSVGSGGGSATGGSPGSGGAVVAGAAGTGGTPGSGGSAGGAGGTGGGAGSGTGGAAPGVPLSCAGMSGDECGNDDCCATLAVPGGWFAMGRGEGTACGSQPQLGGNCTTSVSTCQRGANTWACPEGTWIDLGGDDQEQGEDDETPEHAAQVTGFVLDKYEVTVGRMRRFVDAYDKTALLGLLDAGAGAHPIVAASGWQNSWDDRLPDDQDALGSALLCDDASQTWTDTAAGNETYPISCISWYLAYAFCAWDGGRLPTEAEWEYAAAGGDENRLYPWGDAAPTAAMANYQESDYTTSVDVFAKPAGAGRWEHQGLAGSVWEWTLDLMDPDWYGAGGSDCRDCANVSGDGARSMRGGDWQYHAISLRAAERFAGSAGSYWLGAGIRCARNP